MKYCKNCGRMLEEGAAGCPVCGCPAGMGAAYCGACGEKQIAGSAFCVHCGAPTGAVPAPCRARSRYAAAAFGIVTGAYGVHSFYLGNIGIGIAQIAITLLAYGLVIFGLLPAFAGLMLSGLWGFIDGVRILVGDIKTDAAGLPLRQWNE